MSKLLFPVLVVALFLMGGCDCGKDNDTGTGPSGPSAASGLILDSADSTAVAGANVILYDAGTNSPVTRTNTGTDGSYTLTAEAGVYYIKVSAQGYFPSPAANGAPLPFTISAHDTTAWSIYIVPDPSTANLGYIAGYVRSADSAGISGALTVAVAAGDSLARSGASGPDGYFVIYNLAAGQYTLSAYLAGYRQDTLSVPVVLSASEYLEGITVVLNAATLPSLEGKVTFLASKNAAVDVTLLHAGSLDAVPGLQTFTEQAYTITDIPPGTYVAWASYKNDGYVMDPDWVRKNGLPTVSFIYGDSVKTVDFSVTDAIELVSPTNDSSSVVPVAVYTVRPVFRWLKYSSAKEYIIAVYNSSGSLVWGGYDAAGTILHTQVPASADSAVFDFDSTATAALKTGESYRWQVYADNDAAAGVQGLISASEVQMGLFSVVSDTGGSQ